MNRRMQNRVFVLNKHGEALMPCRRSKARKLLRDNKADAIKQHPLTIQLRYGSSGYTQQVDVGVDSGQNTMGLAIVSQNKVLWQGEVSLRQDVKGLLDTRRSYRRGRRQRNTRYRKPRFNNRKRKDGWLPPSVESKIQHNIRWIGRINSLVPNSTLHIEVGKFDMQKMKNPFIQGLGYQQGNLYGYENVKYYVFARDNHMCQICKKKNVPLQVHHIKYRHLGGTNRVENLLTVCTNCHTHQNHQKGGKLYKLMKKNKKASTTYKGATFMNILRRRLFDAFPDAHFTYGYKTAVSRTQLGLQKGHFNDAIASTSPDKIVEQPNTVVLIKQFRKKKRSLHEATPRKGRKVKNVNSRRNKKNTPESKGFTLNDFVRTLDGRKGYIQGFASNGNATYIVDIHGNYQLHNEKYKNTPLGQVIKVSSHNTWRNGVILMNNYEFR